MGDQGICFVPDAAGSYAVYLNKQFGKHMLCMMTAEKWPPLRVLCRRAYDEHSIWWLARCKDGLGLGPHERWNQFPLRELRELGESTVGTLMESASSAASDPTVCTLAIVLGTVGSDRAGDQATCMCSL